MTWVELVLLAISLSFDTFAVSVSGGICLPNCCTRWKRVEIWMSFAIFQTLFALIGLMLGESVIGIIGSFDHWIAFGLLVYLGGKMIKDAFSSQEEGEGECLDLMRRKTMVTMSVATSIDALAVGISFACTGMNTWQSILSPIIIIGFVSFAFSIAGCFIGVYFGKRINLRAELLAGVILIGIGVKILIEHMEWI